MAYLSSLSLAGDVGGQRTLRPYWRNYFEQTDAVVWVVDSGDRFRLEDCKRELGNLLVEEVRVGIWQSRVSISLIDSAFLLSRRRVAFSRRNTPHLRQ